MYKLNVVWYTIVDAVNTKTNATIWKENLCIDVERDGVQNPFVIVQGSNWQKIIVLVHYQNHYQSVKQHIKL